MFLIWEFLFYFVHIILGEGCVEVKIEADTDDITEHTHHDQPIIGMLGFSDALFHAVIFLFVFSFTWC